MSIRRLLPPTNVPSGYVWSFSGNSYSCPIGQALDVGDAQADVLRGNGWIGFGDLTCGPSAQRPPAPNPRTHYLDTTLNAYIIHDGQNWRDPLNGSVLSGTTSQRPTAPYVGQTFIDTTLSITVVWDGLTWRNTATGLSVLSGTTAQRPASPYGGQTFIDTALSITVVWDGAAWRNIATGAIA